MSIETIDWYAAVDELGGAKLVEYVPLRPYVEEYADLQGVPLRVVMTLREGARLAGYDPLNLDNLLARAVMIEATKGAGMPTIPGAYQLPVPLHCLWRSNDGLPLWAATPFYPVGEAIADVAYWHKRVQSGRFTGTKTGNFTIRPTNGRFMERRVPLPTKLCREWYAEAIGDPEEITRLLSSFGFIGKRHTNGFGEVESWEVQPLDEFRLVRDGCLTRALPGEAITLLNGLVPEGQMAPVGWTPPQWKAMLFRPGWWAETRVG